MAETWQFQIRMTVAAELAEALRAHTPHKDRGLIEALLRERDAALKCQYDAFADYVAEAESAEGAERSQYPLYQWTRETIENPEKKAKYLKSFTVYVGGEPVYDEATADWLQAQLSVLTGSTGIESVSRFDTNPANSPQPPRRP